MGLDGLLCENDGDDETVESDSFAEDQDKDHSHEDLTPSRVRPYSGVPRHSDRIPSRQGAQTATESRREVRECPLVRVIHTVPN